MKEKRNFLVCPICNTAINDELLGLDIDKYFEGILSECSDASDVEIFRDGTFRAVCAQPATIIPKSIDDEEFFEQDCISSLAEVKPEYGDQSGGGPGPGGYPISSGASSDMYSAATSGPDTSANLNFFNVATAAAEGVYPAALGMLSGGAPLGVDPACELMKRDKEPIYAHPLFPLLSILFQKCELATSTPREPSKDNANPENVPVCPANSFNNDLQEFIKTVHREKPFYIPNPELDTLMLNAIQVLRYHLLELEKVHELCDNFCDRYVKSLKSKVPMDLVVDDRAPSAHSIQPPEAVGHMQQYQQGPSSSMNLESGKISPGDGSSGGTPHPGMQSQSQGSMHYVPYEPQSVPLAESSQGMHHHENNAPPQQNNSPATQMSPGTQQSTFGNVGLASPLSGLDGSSIGSGSSKKRGCFPMNATTKLKHWLLRNLTHPYPSEEQKKQLAAETGLANLQINNWFINARRRIVQLMIESNNRQGRVSQVNVFENRGGKSSGDSLGRSPDISTPLGGYSPQDSAIATNQQQQHMLSAITAATGNPGGYPSAAAASTMFTTGHNPYAHGFTAASAFPNPSMFMSGAMMNHYVGMGPPVSNTAEAWIELSNAGTQLNGTSGMEDCDGVILYKL